MYRFLKDAIMYQNNREREAEAIRAKALAEAEGIGKKDEAMKKYGEGNSAKLVGDIVNSTTQITEGISAGMGIDLKSLLMGALGGRLVTDQTPAVIVVPQAQSHNDEA